jgi:putative ABC transport system permease protein
VHRVIADFARASRLFRTSPGFAVAVVAAIALGIGTTTAIFSVVNAVVLKPLPFPEPDRIVQLQITRDGAEFGTSVSPAKFMVWSELRGEVFSDLAGFMIGVPFTFNEAEVPEVIAGARVSEAYFRVFGAEMARGRTFTPDEDLPNAAPAVVLSHAFWRNRLAADPDVVGKALAFGGVPYTVVGVVGESFDLDELGGPEVFIPLQLDPATTDHSHTFRAAARLASGVGIEQAQARMAASVATFHERHPTAVQEGESFTAVTLREALVGDTSRTLWVLLGAVAFVLLIACINVAGLMLIRASRRRREIAIRFALGAGRRRIVQQLLIESMLLAAAGGMLGVGLGLVAMRALLAIDTAGLPRLFDAGASVGMDWRVATFAVAVSIGTGVLFGLMPALASARVDLSTVINSAGSRAGHDRRDSRTRSGLVLVEIALAVVLLIGAALLIRTSIALGSVERGFSAHNVLLVRTSLSGSRYASTASVEQAVRAGRERLLAVPGVISAGTACCVPTRFSSNLPFNVVGRELPQGEFTGGGDYAVTGPGYFTAFRIPLLRGRDFSDADTGGAPGAVIVSEAFANRFWPDGDALGARISIGGGRMNILGPEPEREIVGIVGDVRNRGLDTEPTPTMYVPQAQLSDTFNAFYLGNIPLVWAVHTAVPAATVAETIENELRQVTGVPVIDTETMEEVVSTSIARERFNMLLMSIFGGAALVLAALGIYGLMAYSVQQRTRELGLRIALGAEPSRIRGMVLRQGGLLVGAGVALGCGAALYLARWLESFLFGVGPLDGLVFAGVPTVLLLIGCGTVGVVAFGAGKIDPLVGLRNE